MISKSSIDLLNAKAIEFNSPNFIEDDPISIPHKFSKKKDIEIAGLFSATIAWGNRKSIINNANRLMELVDWAPYQFVSQHTDSDLSRFDHYVHRTFNGFDCKYFMSRLQFIYNEFGDLENAFSSEFNSSDDNCLNAIESFRNIFFEDSEEKFRTKKHVSSPAKGSAAKRLIMFLRWMVRKDENGVDFGIWEKINPHQLSCPLDVHSGTVARKLGLLTRKQNDWKAVIELDEQLRRLDPVDPAKYDFALFGLGVTKEL